MQTNTSWNLFQKIGFRFFFIYCLLFTLPFPLNVFSFLSDVTTFYDNITWKALIPFVSETFFNIPGDSLALPYGSGDTTYNYIQLLCFVVIGILGTLLWSTLDRKREDYARLLRFFVMFLAYYVIYSMFSYGFYKIIPLQFPAPSLGRLAQPYGDSSPMGIAWTFMGASSGYTFFSGLAEVIGGLLLISRRTRTLGGLVCFGVMLNVFMMNMCYDIPVKIYSFHLMLFAFFIFIQDWKRIFAVFITKQAFTPRSFPKYFKNRKFNIGVVALKVIFVGYILFFNIDDALSSNKLYGPNIPKPYMYGIYDITHIEKNQDTIPLLITDDNLWKRLIIQRDSSITAYQMNSKGIWFNLTLDTIQKSMLLEKYSDSTDIYNFRYTLKDSILTLKGSHLNDTILIKAKQYDLKKFKLTNRGFHWINEYPYNR